MKETTLTFALLLAIPVLAQDKTQCRPMGSNDFVHPDESIVIDSSGTLICKTVKPVAVADAKVQESPAPTPAASANAPAAPAAATAPTSALASVPATPAAAALVAPEAEQATIYFYRPRRFVGSALKPSVFVDSTNVGRMHNGDSMKFSVAPGTHEVYSNDKSTGLSLEAKPGQTYYVRIDIQTGAFKGHGGITLIDPQQGRYEIKAVTHTAENN